MKINKKKRTFKVNNKIKLTQVADILLNSDEMITMKDRGKEFDITKKNWGYYATPSINKRLKSFGYATAIIKNKVTKNIFIVLVDKEKKKIFDRYIKSENLKILKWLHE